MANIKQPTENKLILHALKESRYHLVSSNVSHIFGIPLNKITSNHISNIEHRLDMLIEKYENLNKPQTIGK